MNRLYEESKVLKAASAGRERTLRSGLMRATSLVAMILVAAWMLLANLGCGDFWELVRDFTIRFSPESAVISRPSESGTTRAQLWWANGDRLLEATSWEITGERPPVLSTATVSPAGGVGETTISWTSAGAAGLNDEGLFVAAAEQTYQLGVKARFPDPTWKSLLGAEDEKVTISRTGYLPVVVGLPRITVELTGQEPSGAKDIRVSFKLTAREVAGFTYLYRTSVAAFYSDTGQWGPFTGEWKQISSFTYAINFIERGFESAVVWVDTEIRHNNVKVQGERLRFEVLP